VPADKAEDKVIANEKQTVTPRDPVTDRVAWQG
jgi:hypothetical protein